LCGSLNRVGKPKKTQTKPEKPNKQKVFTLYKGKNRIEGENEKTERNIVQKDVNKKKLFPCLFWDETLRIVKELFLRRNSIL